MKSNTFLAIAIFLLGSLSVAAPRFESVVIMGINDLHGNIMPVSQNSEESNPSLSQKYTYGGAEAIAGYTKILRQEYGKHFLLLDAGDQWQGTLESNTDKGASVINFYNLLGVDVATIGNHEFDFGSRDKAKADSEENLRAQIQRAKYPYVSANIYDAKTNRLVDFKNLRSSVILHSGDLKIGVIGLTTQSTPETTATEISNLKFEDLVQTTLTEAKKVRAEGADIVVVLAHAGTVCEAEANHKLTENRVRKITDVQGSCDEKGEIAQFLNNLPKGTVDAVVSGHTHTLIHHWINGVPVIQSEKNGKYFELLRLTYDHHNHRVVSDETTIEGPIPVCEKVFANQNDCDGKSPISTIGRGQLIPTTFHGHTLIENPKVDTFVAKVEKRTSVEASTIVGSISGQFPYSPNEESLLGNFVADTLREKTGADFGIITSGNVRSSFERGLITYGDVYRVFPFDNAITVLTVTGAELKDLVAVSESKKGKDGSVSGLKIVLQSAVVDGKRVNSGKVLSITTKDGEEIQDDKTYTLATSDFLARGGDGWGPVVKNIPPDHIHLTGGLVRDALVDSLRAQLGTEQNSFMDKLGSVGGRLILE